MINFYSEGTDDGTYSLGLTLEQLVREYLRANPFTFKRWAIQYAKAVVAEYVESANVVLDVGEPLPDIDCDADWDTPIIIPLQRVLLTAMQQIEDGQVTVDDCLESLRTELARRKHEHKLLHRDLTELLEATSEQ